MDELFEQSRNIFVGDFNEPGVYPKQIAFNVIPQAGDFLDDGSTTEEWKLVVETKKILDPGDQGHRDLRPRAGVRRPFGSGEHRVRE